MLKKKHKPFLIIIFILYFVSLVYILLLKGNISISPKDFTIAHHGTFRMPGNYNLTLLETIRLYITDIKVNQHLNSYLNLIGNIILFIPFGFMFPLLTSRRRTALLTFLTATLFILLIEFIQLITVWGIFDVDDYILNILGVMIGWILQKILIHR